jgi:hypothetical protein
MFALMVRNLSTQPAGVVLVVASALFIVGAGLAPETPQVFTSPLREHLEILNRRSARWRLMNGLMFASVLGTATGLWLFLTILTRAGDEWRALLATVGYSLGAVLWVLSLGFRHTTVVAAARETARTGEIPGWLEPLQEWTGWMYSIYMVLAYAAVALFGWAIVRTDVVGHGVGWFAIVFGYAFGAAFVTKQPRTPWGPIADLPVLIHFPTLVFGIALLK